MSAISSDEIISILKEEIENYEVMSRDQEVGTVVSVGDGIATIYGIDHAMYGEIVTLENGLKGMVQDIKLNEISCILFGDDSGIKQGTKVARTGKRAGIPVGEAYIGRIVDPLGAPIDGRGEIKADGYRPIEQEAPGIVERKSVSVPLETGILSIDSMFPIGRGQRELIIGDRQTGKTSIAMDAILNPEGEGCYLYLCGDRAEGIHRSPAGEYAKKQRCLGLYYGILLYGKRMRATPIYRPVFGDCSGRIFYVPGKGCPHCL